MPISQGEVNSLIRKLNRKISKQGMSFVMTEHVAIDRINDRRNNPPITLAELENLLNSLISTFLFDIAKLPHNSTFNIRCKNSHINIPCGVSKCVIGGNPLQKNTMITVMRKEFFKSKDPVEFIVGE